MIGYYEKNREVTRGYYVAVSGQRIYFQTYAEAVNWCYLNDYSPSLIFER